MWLSDLPIIMIRCLFCTIVIETVMALIIGIREKKDLLNVILVNIVTNPLVVIFPVVFEIQFGYQERMISIIVLEVLAFLFEGFVYYKWLKYQKINGFLVSLILNMSSYWLGELINYFIYA